MKISKEDVLHIAHLARISLTESQTDHYRESLKKILTSMNELQAVNTDSVEMFLNPIRETGDFRAERDDKVEASIGEELVLSNAPDSQYGQFKLEAIMDSES